MSYNFKERKIVVIKRKTALEELVLKFGTKEQAKFYIEHSGLSFDYYSKEDAVYQESFKQLLLELDLLSIKRQVIDKEFLPNFLFAPDDIIIVIGQDGMVANTAKYLDNQPIIAVNPDPERIDGILLPFTVKDIANILEKTLKNEHKVRSVSMAQVELNNGQKLLAFNDFFIGAKSHVSARYKIKYGKKEENQSSSGIIISTGAGSTGWLSSVFNMTNGILKNFVDKNNEPMNVNIDMGLSWEAERLVFVVREPFKSVSSSTSISFGVINSNENMTIESKMATGGIIFSDGIENDFLDFNSGLIAKVSLAKKSAKLVVK